MAFDRTNPAHLLTLKTEVTTDPIAMGYASAPNEVQLVKLLNDTASNTGNGTAGQETSISRPFDVFAMLDALVPSDYGAQQTDAGAANYVHTLVELSAFSSIEPYKTKFRDMFAANSPTVTALDAQTQDISRAEALFGFGTVIVFDDWVTARDS